MSRSERRRHPSPVRFAFASLGFGGTLIALVPRLLREAHRPDPITLEPRILRSSGSLQDH